jgi:uncharacterized BrkB/YihY/UPF0761 family membrane protein
LTEVSPDASSEVPPEPEPAAEEPEQPHGLKARYVATRERIVEAEKALQASRPRRPLVHLVYCILERDAERGGGLIAGALAYRIFFWVLPFALVLVGAIGFASSSDAKAPQDIAKAGGAVGFAAQSIAHAASDSPSFRWWALIIGLPALYFASISFVKALRVAHGLLWAVPPGRMRGKPIAAIAMTGILVATMAALSFENRLRAAAEGPGLFAVAFFIVVVAVLWLFVAVHMPRADGTTWKDILPGCVAVATGGQIVHIITIYYVSRKVSGASSTYGALGAAAGILLSLFFLARVAVLGTLLNVELWARTQRRRTGEPEPERAPSPLVLDE